MKKIWLIFALMITIFIKFTPVNAADNFDTSSAVFTLNDEYQCHTVYDKNGIPVTLSLNHAPSTTKSLADDTYTISAERLGVYMSYQATIRNNKMVSVSNAQYSILLATITDKHLVLVSPVYSYFTVAGNNPLGSFSYVLSATINNGNLVTSFQ